MLNPIHKCKIYIHNLKYNIEKLFIIYFMTAIASRLTI
nr:MAG TPA: hypothetical protein [Caudoviricetes sp.]